MGRAAVVAMSPRRGGVAAMHRVPLLATALALACWSHDGSAPSEPEPTTPAVEPTAGTTFAATPSSERPSPVARPIFRTDLPHVTPTRGFVRAARFGEIPGGARLARFDDGTAAAFAGPEVVLLDADGGVQREPMWLRGIEGIPTPWLDGNMRYWTPIALGGSWPEGASITVGIDSAARGGAAAPAMYRRMQGRWHRIADAHRRFDRYAAAFGPWKRGSVLALMRFEPRFSTEGEGIEPPRAEVRAFAAAIASQKRLVVLHGEGKAPAFAAMDLRAFASSPTGELIAAAQERRGPVMLHHDGTTTRRRPLPGADAELQIDGIVMLARDHAYAYGRFDEDGRGYLARFDGAAWHEITELPCSAAIHAASADRDGTLYATCGVGPGVGNSALLRWQGGALQELGLPTDADEGPVAVLARAPDDIWVVTGGWAEGGESLWHTGGPELPATLPSLAESNAAALEWAEPAPMHAECLQAWIPLAPGADRADVLARLQRAQDVPTSLHTVRVQGTVQSGLVVSPSPALLRTLSTLLGDAIGEPSCNERPTVGASTQ